MKFNVCYHYGRCYYQKKIETINFTLLHNVGVCMVVTFITLLFDIIVCLLFNIWRKNNDRYNICIQWNYRLIGFLHRNVWFTLMFYLKDFPFLSCLYWYNLRYHFNIHSTKKTIQINNCHVTDEEICFRTLFIKDNNIWKQHRKLKKKLIGISLCFGIFVSCS